MEIAKLEITESELDALSLRKPLHGYIARLLIEQGRWSLVSPCAASNN